MKEVPVYLDGKEHMGNYFSLRFFKAHGKTQAASSVQR